MKKLVPKAKCVTCDERERAVGSYCRPCRNDRVRKRYALIQAGLAVKGTYKSNGKPKTSCNCGNALCNGLRCASIRYGTAS